jgi:hypothetical protein
MTPRARTKTRGPAQNAGQSEDRSSKPAAGVAAPRRGETYFYGIIRWPLPSDENVLGVGVGDPPRALRAVRLRSTAALVSDVSAAEMSGQGLRGMRRDMKAHAAALNRIAAKMTVLPVRFGVVLPDDRALISRFMTPQYERLDAYLDHLEGAVEITLRATSVEEQALREVIAARPELAASGGGRRGASLANESRIEAGRQIAAAIQDLQDRDARWIVEALAPMVRDLRIGKPLRDLMALNVSFLVDRSKLKKFDRVLEKLNAEVGHRIEFDCVGPLAPYSFVDLRL